MESPLYGPDRERSDLIRIPKDDLRRIICPGETLRVARNGEAYHLDGHPGAVG